MTKPDNTPSANRKCIGCGAELPGSTPPDLCPKCLLKLAMDTQPAKAPDETAVVSTAETSSAGLPQPGQQLGHYAIIRALGRGGMGAVYEAEDLENGRRVALKVLSHKLDSPDGRERFFREGRLAASINHPNSVYIFGTEEIGGTPVIAMELVSGGTLQERVRDRGPLPIGEAVDCVLQIIEGLAAAQRLGILHRDIKPSNCYVGEDGAVKIGDFGLSISTTVRTEPALTATGAFLGTPAFCSPEQLRGDELNARSDMYSVGATLYYLLTGRTPFEAKSMVQLLATVLEQRAPSPRKLRPDIPQPLARAILRCLEKPPGERFKSYAELSQALAPFGSSAPTPATLGLRFLAGLLDMSLLGAAALLVNFTAFGSPMSFMDELMQLSPKVLVCILGWFCLVMLYFALFEGLWGATAGKAICRLRVVGPDRNPPGFWWACLRALVWVVPPFLPFWLVFGTNPRAYLTASPLTQILLSSSLYALMAVLFVTARRRNGFAAVQDLLSRTRVVSRGALAARPVHLPSETPPPALESAAALGPYHVLQPLGESAGAKWLLAYDLKLLRKVWLRVVPPGTEPIPVQLRSLGRVGRLRWLTGKRAPDQNWDAFEGLTGRPLLEAIRRPQPWSEVRFWLNDLASEISATEKDGRLPELALDRVWITGEGRAKLLDFPAPVMAPPDDSSPSETSAPSPVPFNDSATQPFNSFLNAVASAALTGNLGRSTQPAADVPVRLPLHARAFLKSLSQMTGADAVAAALKPLLNRVAVVSGWRRAALVGGCMAFPLMTWAFVPIAMGFMQDLTRKNPGLMDLSSLLQMRTSARFWGGANPLLPTDRQLAIYLAHHYAGLITNSTSWSNPYVLSMIKGDARKFAEQSVAEHPAPTEAEIKEADAAVTKFVPEQQSFVEKPPPALPAMVLASSLFIYVGLPAVLAALLFRGGVVLLIAGVTYARKDGARASRLRLLWRALVIWTPVLPVFSITVLAFFLRWTWQPWLALGILGWLAAVSVVLPERGLQDRLAGTWPVPR
jgi:eukaryotic-like serine/threonine-protein kinase